MHLTASMLISAIGCASAPPQRRADDPLQEVTVETIHTPAGWTWRWLQTGPHPGEAQSTTVYGNAPSAVAGALESLWQHHNTPE